MISPGDSEVVTLPQAGADNEPLRVALWRTNYLASYGGAEKVVHDLAEQLMRRGHRMMILADEAGTGRNRFFPSLPDGVDIVALPIANPLLSSVARRPLALLRYAGGLARAGAALRRFRADVVHLHVLTLDVLALVLLRKLLGFRLIVTMTGGELEFARASRFSGWKLGTALRHADVVTCVADEMLRELGEYPARASTVHITNPIDVARLSGRFGDPPDEPVGRDFLFCGRLHAVKQVERLLRAFELHTKTAATSRLRIVGDGPDLKAAREWVLQRNLEDRIAFLGPLPHDQVLEEVSRCRALLLSSRSEGCPIVLLEAMALGRPVVAPAVGGIPELITNGENGYLYESGSVEELAEAMSSLCDRDRAHRLGSAGRRRVAEAHAMGPIVDRYLGIYRGADAISPSNRH
jgi:glycosyltransferase involved in cell wall biosynthesis